MTHHFDALVLGAGAAGLMCALEAGKRGRRVAVLERAERAGKKILISGGGRCNFTNLHCRPENFISANPHFAKSALARYTPSDFIALVEKHRIPYHEKKLGQLFCDRSAHDITDMLESECRDAGVRLFLNASLQGVSRTAEFVVRAGEEEFCAPALVVATGGLSIPKMGATGLGYDLARQFGLKIREPRPALVPLVFADEDRDQYCDLAGVSADVAVACNDQRFPRKDAHHASGIERASNSANFVLLGTGTSSCHRLSPRRRCDRRASRAQSCEKYYHDEISVTQVLTESFREPMAPSASAVRMDKPCTRRTRTWRA
jgi:predicted Rossmann fold flavoprotein